MKAPCPSPKTAAPVSRKYHIEERHEAGIVLEGWEIKAIRAGQVQLTDGYVSSATASCS